MIPPVYALLTTDSAFTALAGARVYRHGHAPQDSIKPYVTWSVVGGHAENYLSGRPGIDQELAQIDIWADDAQTCKAVMLATVAALELHGHQSGMPMDGFEDATQLYRFTLQMYFWTPR